MGPSAHVCTCAPFVVVGLACFSLWVLRGRFDYQEYGLLDRTQLRFYTLKTARELIENTGYKIESFHFSTAGVTELEQPILRLPRGGYRLRCYLLHQLPELFGYELIFVARKG